MTEEAKRKQYQRPQMNIKFSDSPADMLIWRHLQDQENRTEYIRRLIWADLMEERRNGKKD